MARRLAEHGLTHLTAARQPTMVDIGDKTVTHRVAEAEALLQLPAAVAQALRRSGHRTHKGPVFDTAIVAGVMAVKRTADIVPFCHPLPIDHCSVEVEARGTRQLRVICRVETRHKTGVEMEALTGAAVAALTIYDMCKALSHDIRITGVRLLHKSGGKRQIGTAGRRPPARRKRGSGR